MFNHAYPYTDAHELNLDWLLKQYTNLVNEFSTVKIGFEEIKLRFEEIQTQFEGFDAAFEAFKQEVLTQFGTLSADFEQRFNDLSQSIESQLSGIDTRIDQFEQTVNTEIADFKQEVEDDFTDFQTDVNAEITRFESEVDNKIDNLNVTDAVNARIDTLVQDGTLQGMAYEVVGNKWNDITTYTEGQMVIHNNVLWKALQTSTNQEPESNEYWAATSVINEIENAAKNAFHVITEESEFEGLTVTATLVNSPEGITEEHTAIIVGGYAQIPFNNIGTWEVKVIESGLTYSETVTVDYYSTYIIRLQKLNAVITVTTPSPELYGKTIKFESGSYVTTGVISSTGSLSKRLRVLGTYIISCTDPAFADFVEPAIIEVNSYTTYSVVLTYKTSTMVDITLEGAKEDIITITNNAGEQVGVVIFDSGMTTANVTLEVHGDSEEFTFTSSISKNTETDTEDFSKTVTIYSDTNDIKVMPVGALYWYGNDCIDITGGWNNYCRTNFENRFTRDIGTQYKKITYNGTFSAFASFRTNNKINISDKSNLHCRFTRYVPSAGQSNNVNGGATNVTASTSEPADISGTYSNFIDDSTSTDNKTYNLKVDIASATWKNNEHVTFGLNNGVNGSYAIYHALWAD